MKSFFAFGLFLLFCLPSAAQTHETFISDTAQVKWYFDNEISDTVFCLRNRLSTGKWIVYYDQKKRKKAFTIELQYYKPANENREKSYSWFRNGNIKSKKYMSRDTCISLYYYPNSRLKSISKSAWMVPEYAPESSATWVLIQEDDYYQNGQIKRTPVDFSSKNVAHKIQPIIAYYENGKKQVELNWMNGAFIGAFNEYYENGKIKTSGLYQTDVNTDPTKPLQNGGKENGKWQYYDENGKLLKEEIYNNGTLISTTVK